MKNAWLAVIVWVSAACTTLGPMPAATGVPPLPAGRPGIEVQGGLAPGHFLSSGVNEDPEGDSMPQLAALFEPDRLIGVPGLFIAGRVVGGGDSGAIVEPMLGFRHAFGERFSGGAVLYGTHASGEANGASYSATRVGLEVAADARVSPRSHWAEVHLVLGAAVTGISADGAYCLDDQRRYGVDCAVDGMPPVDVDASGLYPSGQAAIALDFGRHLDVVFHGARLALQGVVATMPAAIGGVQTDAEPYAALGLLLTIGLGAKK